jgi:hypothetical protein
VTQAKSTIVVNFAHFCLNKGGLPLAILAHKGNLIATFKGESGRSGIPNGRRTIFQPYQQLQGGFQSVAMVENATSVPMYPPRQSQPYQVYPAS